MDFAYSKLKEDYCQLDMDGKESQIKYIGCIGVKTSMKTLNPKERSEVAKESINRLCEANNIKRKIGENHLDHPINKYLEDQPNLKYSGTDVQLNVTSNHLNIVSADTNQIIIQHDMPNVAFASSGDEDTLDFVAYVAKDGDNRRACYVLECKYKMAKTVLHNIALGFQQRTQILCGTVPRINKPITQDRCSGFSTLLDSSDTNLNPSYRIDNETNSRVVAQTRKALEQEPWYHPYLSREISEEKLKEDGDFLVRESIIEVGHFVLSVMHEGTKLHLLFDSIDQVRTKDMKFDNISHLIKYHHNKQLPIVAENHVVYLNNGIRCESSFDTNHRTNHCNFEPRTF